MRCGACKADFNLPLPLHLLLCTLVSDHLPELESEAFDNPSVHCRSLPISDYRRTGIVTDQQALHLKQTPRPSLFPPLPLIRKHPRLCAGRGGVF